MEWPGAKDFILYALSGFFGWYFIRLVNSVEKLNIHMAIVFEELEIRRSSKKGIKT